MLVLFDTFDVINGSLTSSCASREECRPMALACSFNCFAPPTDHVQIMYRSSTDHDLDILKADRSIPDLYDVAHVAG